MTTTTGAPRRIASPRRLVAAIGALTVSMLPAPSSPAGASARSPFPVAAVGATLTDTSRGATTQIDLVDQLRPSLGYAVAAPARDARGPVDLVRSSDFGRRWTIVGALPTSSTTFNDGVGFNEPDQLLHFVTPSTGYLAVPPQPIFVPRDAGTPWRRLAPPGVWPPYALRGGDLWVVSDHCTGPVPPYGPLRCASELSAFRLGATTPFATTPVPALGPAGGWRAAVALLAPTPSSVVVAEGGTEGGRSSLLATADAGRTWRQLADPCQGIDPQQVLSVPGRWLLYCFGDGGMSQGLSELWTSTDAGATWALVARESQGVSDHSRIGDVSNHLYVNGAGTMLYGALGGAAGGLEYSTDDGAYWTSVAIATNWYGGAPEYVSTFGPTGAVFAILAGPQYVTTNGTSWRALPALAAGTYRGLRICTAADVSVHLAPTMTGVPASTLDYPVVFTNESLTSCYLNGSPLVQTVAGANRHPVGQPSFPAGVTGRGGYVVLAPHASASVVVESDDAYHYAASYCRPVVEDGVTLAFAPPARFYVALPHRAVCAGVPTTLNGGVARGIVTWL